jgi:hypothetical protein
VLLRCTKGSHFWPLNSFLLRIGPGCEAAVVKLHATCVKGVKSFPLVCSVSETDHFDIPSYRNRAGNAFLKSVFTPNTRKIRIYGPSQLAKTVFLPTLLVLVLVHAGARSLLRAIVGREFGCPLNCGCLWQHAFCKCAVTDTASQCTLPHTGGAVVGHWLTSHRMVPIAWAGGWCW